MIWLFGAVIALILFACILVACAAMCVAFRHCLEEWYNTFWYCVDCCTKQRATIVHPIEATVVTYLGEIDIENGG